MDPKKTGWRKVRQAVPDCIAMLAIAGIAITGTGSAFAQQYGAGPGQPPVQQRTDNEAWQEQAVAAAVLDVMHRENQTEMEMARMGERKAQSEAVKQYARMVGEDHKANDDLVKSVAKDMKVDLGKAERDRGMVLQKPFGDILRKQNEHRESMEALHRVSKEEFDQAFLSMMVRDHASAIADLERLDELVTEPRVSGLVVQTLPVLRSHLERAQALLQQQGWAVRPAAPPQ